MMTKIVNLMRISESMIYVLSPIDVSSTTSFAGGHRSGLAILNPDDKNSKLRIRVYTDGFLIEGNEFRSFEDPNNAPFIARVRAGEVPDELTDQVRSAGGEVRVELTDIDRAFNPTIDRILSNPVTKKEPKDTAFRGEGLSLGSSSSQPEPIQGRIVLEELSYPAVDDTRPVTNIQIRLPSGNRCIRSFNSESTAIVIVEIIASASGASIENINLSAGFPPRSIPHLELSSKSIQDLGLCNSAISVSFR